MGSRAHFDDLQDDVGRISRLMLDAIGQAVVGTDIAGTVTYWNSAAVALYGWSPAEAIGAHFADLTVPRVTPEETQVVLQTLTSGATWIGEVLVERRDESTFIAHMSNSGIFNSDGQMMGIIAVSTDLTDVRRSELAGRDNESRWQSLVSESADAAVIADAATHLITWVSPTVTRLFGWLPDELVGRAARTLVHPEDAHLLETALQAVLIDPAACARVEFRAICRDGSHRWVEETIRNLVDDPSVSGLVANIRDITPRRAAEEALRTSEARHRLIAETAQEGMWATDSSGKTLYANQKMADLLGCSISDFYSSLSHELVTGVNREAIVSRQEARGISVQETYDLSHTRPDGSDRLLQVSASPLVEAGGYIGSLAMITDVTAARDAERELVYRATHDPLTGLANRTLLMERLQGSLDCGSNVEAGATAAHVAVLVADMDQFKLVNDSFGHAAGDELLVEVSRRWGEMLIAPNLVARFGGDEFVVLCEDADEQAARDIGDQLLKTLEVPVVINGRPVAVSASIGIAVASQVQTSTATSSAVASDLLRYADAAMYQAKSLGRGRTAVFDHRLIDRAQSRLRLFTELKSAIERDELILHYQPVVELSTGRLLGVEALCRWVHPVRGLVPPDQFIPVAEETGLVDVLDAWVLRRACSDGARMRAIGVLPQGAYIAVNASAAHLSQPGFEATVKAALVETGFPACALVLEVTESAVMRDPDVVQLVLERLHSLGVSIAIDDFGTGYSSLAYLSRFPVATLKIDRGFVEKLTHSADDRAIVTAIADLARALKLETTAEGIETFSELALLQGLGCQAGQGFLWSRALPLRSLADLLSKLPGGRFHVVPPASPKVNGAPAPRNAIAGVTMDGWSQFSTKRSTPARLPGS